MVMMNYRAQLESSSKVPEESGKASGRRSWEMKEGDGGGGGGISDPSTTTGGDRSEFAC